MKKLKYIVALAGASVLLTGCLGKIHSHNSDKWEYDTTSHWQTCSSCHQQFNKKPHTIDANDHDCHTCGYHDPMCVVDNKGTLTGLTEYGKNYTGTFAADNTSKKHNDFGKANTIAKNAFKGSKASEIIIPKNINGCEAGAFDSRDNLKFEEEIESGVPGSVQWIEIDGVYYKENVYENNVAMVNGLFYPTLKEAFASVREDNTIVKIVKPVLNAGTEFIPVNHKIILESHTGTTTLNANFEIFYTGQLEVNKSINYVNGKVHLTAQTTTEKCGETEVGGCVTTGSIYFPNATKGPEGVSFKYYDLNSTMTTAIGHVQTFKNNSEFSSNISCFAYGVFNYDRTTNEITGLTEFGKTITKLTISKFYEKDDHTTITAIKNYAFNKKETKDLDITVGGTSKTVNVTGHFQKGIFKELIIENLFEKISEGAFSASFTRTGKTVEEQRAIERKLSTITSLETYGSTTEICEDAFRECGSLTTIRTYREAAESGLSKIGKCAFKECKSLQSADFSQSINLKIIGENAFYQCTKLNSVYLNQKNGWMATNGSDAYHFAEVDLNPQTFATMLSNTLYADHEFKVVEANRSVYAYHPNDKDGDGIHNKAILTNSIGEMFNDTTVANIKDGSIIHITDEYDPTLETGLDITIKNNHSVYIQNDKGADGEVTLDSITVEAGAYVVLGPYIKVTNGIKLKIDGSNHELGGAAFTYSSELYQYPGVSIGDNNLQAEPATIRMDLEGDKICIGYGLAYYTKDGDHQTLRKLSHLGMNCKDLELKSQEASNTSNVKIVDQFNKANNLLENLTLGDTVIETGGYAFQNCRNLETVKAGVGLSILGDYSFDGCSKLREFNLTTNTNLGEIKQRCFVHCGSLKVFRLSDDNHVFHGIGVCAFEHTSLNIFHFPRNDDVLNEGWVTTSGAQFWRDDLVNEGRMADEISRRLYAEGWNKGHWGA